MELENGIVWGNGWLAATSGGRRVYIPRGQIQAVAVVAPAKGAREDAWWSVQVRVTDGLWHTVRMPGADAEAFCAKLESELAAQTQIGTCHCLDCKQAEPQDAAGE